MMMMTKTTNSGSENERDQDDDDDNNIVVLTTTQQEDPEQYPHMILQGRTANLSALRGTDEHTKAIFFDERNRNFSEDGPLLLETSVPVSATTTTIPAAQSPPDAVDGQEESSTTCSGEVFVTNTQVLFVASDSDRSDSDLAIGATRIVLHAMTEDPDLAIYLQLSGCEESLGMEVTLTPQESANCQPIFDALCRLISLHPLDVDDDDENENMFGGGWIGGGFGDDPIADYGERDELVWAPLASASVAGAATLEEREAMLQHLDNLLVVRPDLEITQDGQFDDAIGEHNE